MVVRTILKELGEMPKLNRHELSYRKRITKSGSFWEFALDAYTEDGSVYLHGVIMDLDPMCSLNKLYWQMFSPLDALFIHPFGNVQYVTVPAWEKKGE